MARRHGSVTDGAPEGVDMVETLLREAGFEALSSNDQRPAMCCTFEVEPAQEPESL